jgi:diguanylate cyclase (GGDEF)-like protein
MKIRSEPHRYVPEAVEIELIRSVFHAILPSSVMTICFAVAGSIIYLRTNDPNLLLLLIIGIALSIVRLIASWFLAPSVSREDVTLDRALRLEARFGAAYLSFALVLGAFGYRAFTLPHQDVHMLVAALLTAYCAGVAVGMGSRLRIAVPSMVLALAPIIVAAFLTEDLLYNVTGAVIAAILVSGIQSLRERLRRSVEDIGLRLTFAQLARKDALTALPNRIALKEWYERRVTSARDDSLIAVHYLDLNGFKPVNDQYGHPVGDALLSAAGKRIARVIRESDIVARLGGDEFAVVQHGIANSNEAEQLAARLSEALAKPFRIRSLTLRISTGLGYVVSRGKDEDLEDLLSLADKALYVSKSTGAFSQYEAVEAVKRRVA